VLRPKIEQRPIARQQACRPNGQHRTYPVPAANHKSTPSPGRDPKATCCQHSATQDAVAGDRPHQRERRAQRPLAGRGWQRLFVR